MSRKKIKIDDKNNMIDPLLPLRQTKFHDNNEISMSFYEARLLNNHT